MRYDPIIPSRTNREAREMAREIAIQVWSYCSDEDEKQKMITRNKKINRANPDCLIFFYGQFTPSQQLLFIRHLMEYQDSPERQQIRRWIEHYEQWIAKGKRPEVEEGVVL